MSRVKSSVCKVAFTCEYKRNQPASRSPQAKYIKQCMVAPKGKILVANDYTALTTFKETVV